MKTWQFIGARKGNELVSMVDTFESFYNSCTTYSLQRKKYQKIALSMQRYTGNKVNV